MVPYVYLINTELALYGVIGLLATLLGSMSGLGGGFLSVPVLYYAGVAIQVSVATSKFMVFINSIVSTYRYSRRLRIPIETFIAVVTPMMITAYYGAYLVAVLPINTLKVVIGLILLVVGARMVIQGQPEKTPLRSSSGLVYYTLSTVSGAIAGLVAGITGLGGGIVNVPVFIYILGLDPHLAVSLSMACMAPSALTSVLRHFIDGLIDWNIGIPLSIGALIGGWIGPRVALGTRKEKLVRIIGAILLVAILRMLLEPVFGL
jgi:uncharacterized membrane protein YfcA